MNQEQLNKVTNDAGFIAALDQSGGSTPKALANYGVEESAYNGEDEMYAAVHAMRSRIITSPAFTGEHILGAILFEKTMDSDVEGKPTATYLWEDLQVVPFLKVDKGLADEADGVQMMKPMPNLDALLEKAVSKGIFGTKMRSVINKASPSGIKAIVDQQFGIGKQILAHGLVPIIEPEVTISNTDKAECETLMRSEILRNLDALNDDQKVMLKLTLPEESNFFAELIAHKNVVRVVALSGGYDEDEACTRLSQNDGMIASFSRALSQNLNFNQSEEEFNAALDAAIKKIFNASMANAQSQAA